MKRERSDGKRPTAARGFTLVELLVVAMILVALAGILVPFFEKTFWDAPKQTTQVTLTNLRQIVMGNDASPGYFGDLRQLPETMADLFVTPSYLPTALQTFDRNAARGWRGPYVQNQTGTYTVNATAGFTTGPNANGTGNPGYGNANDPAVMDAWNHPVVLQIPTGGTGTPNPLYARLVSAGPDGVIQTPPDTLYPLPSARGDDLVIFLQRADTP
jgi:prepilin-type N-terminal cleavage/methylation domain-containing protein